MEKYHGEEDHISRAAGRFLDIARETIFSFAYACQRPSKSVLKCWC